MQRRFSPWYLVIGLGLMVEIVACPKPKTEFQNKKPPSTEPVVDVPKGDKFEKCYGQDWTQSNKIDPVLKAQCNDPIDPFEAKIQPCFSYDWADGKVPAEMQAICEKVGFKERVGSCKSYSWSNPDEIPEDERNFCKRLGFRDVVDPEICEKQDWTKPDDIKPLLKAQCLKISLIPKCNPKKEKGCVAEAAVVFNHSQHGVDLPAKKADKELKFKDHLIVCADCHNSECKKDKKGNIQADVNRPGHDSCSGTRTGGCHPDFISNKKVCAACHSGAPRPGNKALKAYGTDVVVQGQQYGFDFSHKSHLASDGVLAKDGSRVAQCADCHTLVTSKDKATTGVKMSQATHSQCGQCHCDERNQIKMSDCLECHKQDTAENAQSGHAYLDYRPHAQAFKHSSHQTGPDKAPIKCADCHVAVADTDSIEEIPVPPMLGCLQGCHDGSHVNDAKPVFDGWIQCSQCHAPGDLPPSISPKDKKKK